MMYLIFQNSGELKDLLYLEEVVNVDTSVFVYIMTYLLVVFILQASLDSELNKNKGRLKGFISLCREIISRFIEQYFPTKIENAVSSKASYDLFFCRFLVM